jgi:hypothetical protein
MNILMRKILKISLISLGFVILAVTTFLIYFIFINPKLTTEIEGLDLSKELPADASKVIKVNENNLFNLMKSHKADGYYLQTWNISRECFGLIDKSIIENLNNKYPNIYQMYISVDKNTDNIEKILSLYLYEKNIKIPVYHLDKKLDLFDLENRDNILDFYKFMTKDNNLNYDSLTYGLIFDKGGKLFSKVKNSDSFDEIQNLLDSLYKSYEIKLSY